jgi:putative tricarboxylic transport membrane protein
MTETLGLLANGFAVALTPINLLYALIGTTLGTAIGVLPGIGPALTVALLLPVTYHVEPTAAFIMFAGIYYGGMYGGSTTSILLKTPGETSSIITAIDGHAMARKGRGGAALATAAIGSFVAGTIATVGLTLVAPLVVDVALAFGPAEYFALMTLAFVTVASLLGASVPRGLASLFFGLGIGLIGIDMQTGQPRFALGLPNLLDGIGVVTVAVGLFAVGEALHAASRRRFLGADEIEPVRGSLMMTREEWRRSWPAWLRGTAYGFPIGALPAGGAEIPTFLAYMTEKKLSKRPEEFGQGAIEAVAGPEAANNAAAAGVLVPLLTLGLPTSATAAIMLAAFQQYGLQPGPLLFENSPALIWGLIASLYVGNVMLLVLNLPLVGFWVRLLALPQPLLYGGIMVFAVLGVYAAGQSILDLVSLLLIGLAGFAMRRFDIPVAPTVVGLILGPMAEQQFRRAMTISQGDATVFLTQPIAAALIALALLLLIGPWVWRAAKARR